MYYSTLEPNSQGQAIQHKCQLNAGYYESQVWNT